MMISRKFRIFREQDLFFSGEIQVLNFCFFCFKTKESKKSYFIMKQLFIFKIVAVSLSYII